MRPDALARRYARALFALAQGQQSLDVVGSALATIASVLGDPSVMRVLMGPMPRERKRELLLKIVEQAGAPGLIRDFFMVLADQGRLKHTAAIKTVFDGMLDDERGVTRAAVRSAAPLSQEMLDEITRAFSAITGKRVMAEVDVVPELIAGVIVEVDGRVYDGSLRTELDKLHQQMASGS